MNKQNTSVLKTIKAANQALFAVLVLESTRSSGINVEKIQEAYGLTEKSIQELSSQLP